MRRLLLLVLCCSGCGLILGPSRPYRVCERTYKKEHKEQIAACEAKQQRYDDCMDAVPKVSETYPYFRDEDMDRCRQQFPPPETCYPDWPCSSLYDGWST